MSDQPTDDPDDEYDQRGPLTRMKPFARVAMAIIVLPMVLGVVVGLVVVFADIFRRLFAG